MARVMVTGANGHIGDALIRQLVERGDEVTAFVQPTEDLPSLEGLELTYFIGDMQDRDAIMAAAAAAGPRSSTVSRPITIYGRRVMRR